MRLIIKVISFCGKPATDPQVRSLDTFPIIIGRSLSCDYRLDDASQYVSSNHAVITLQDNKLLIQDTSSNGLYINDKDEPVGRGATVALNNHDTLSIGDFKLSITVDANDSTTRTDVKANTFVNAQQQGAQASVAPYDPFKGDEPSWSTISESEGTDMNPDLWNTDASAITDVDQQSVPKDSDWADWSEWQEDEKPGSNANLPGDDFQQDEPELFVPGDEFDWIPDGDSEIVSGVESAPSLKKAAEPIKPQRIDMSPPSPANSSSRVQSQNSKPQTIKPDQVKVPSKSPSVNTHDNVPSRSTPVASGGAPSLSPVEVLLRAASLRESDFTHINDNEVLEQTGMLLAQMVDAMMVLLRSRAEMKNYIRSDSTQLAKSDNNPLKFSLTSAEALGKLLANDSDGYLQSDKAIREAVEDLKLHQLAMLEGMELSVKSMLSQFDPDKLAKKLERIGGIGANIPITRDAKLWKLFCEQHDAIREEAVTDFGNLFGTEFRKAYEKSIKEKGRQPDF